MAKKAPVPAPTDERHDLAALPIPAVDPSTALAAAATVAKHLAEPKTRRRFDALPDEEVNHAYVASYEALRRAADEASNAYLSTDNAESDALVPEATVQALTAIRKRNFDLIEYHLGDDPEVARELAVIRAGHGYKDLANDVVALLSLREKHLAALKSDKKNYRAEDAVEGPVEVEKVRTARLQGQRPATRKAARAWANAFYALREAHDEIIEVGRFIDRKRAGKEARWPSLYVNVKNSKRAQGRGGNGEGI